MRGRSLLVINAIIVLVAALAAAERVNQSLTEKKPDALEQLIGNSYLNHFISTKSSIDIKKFSFGSKVIICLNTKKIDRSFQFSYFRIL